jgi:hypothetical protein
MRLGMKIGVSWSLVRQHPSNRVTNDSASSTSFPEHAHNCPCHAIPPQNRDCKFTDEPDKLDSLHQRRPVSSRLGSQTIRLSDECSESSWMTFEGSKLWSGANQARHTGHDSCQML